MSDTCDGCSRTTFVITTRPGLISDLGRTLPVVEFQHQGLRIATRLFLCHDLMGCITAIQSRLNNFQLRTRLVRCSGSDGDSRPDPGSRASSTRFWDVQSGRRPRHAKPCCPVKGPPASKTRRHLVLMNDILTLALHSPDGFLRTGLPFSP